MRDSAKKGSTLSKNVCKLPHMPKVSVIIPVYKVERYIERCVRSLFEQTLEDIEYVFVNDCTPDRSMEVLARVLEDYPSRKKQIRILDMPVNSGLARVREEGVKHATGDYIIHCDSDDWTDITMYDKMWSKAVEGNHDIVLCGFFRSDGNGSDIVEKIDFREGDDVCRAMMTDKIECFTWNKLVKREMYGFIRDFPKDNMFEDAAISIPLAFHCKSAGLVDEPLYFYYTNPGGLCRQTVTMGKVRQIERNIQLAADHIRSHSATGTYRKELFHMRCKIKIQAFPLSRNEYMSVCPDVTYTLPFDRYTGIRARLGHVTRCLGIHGISKFFRR